MIIQKYFIVMSWMCLFGVFLLSMVGLVKTVISDPGVKYLYQVDGEENSSFPVVEYLLADEASFPDERNKFDSLHPEFLYKPKSSDAFTPPPRVVQFYAPWCPHCRHYKPQYVNIAREIQSNQPEIVFYAISCVAHASICNSQNVSHYPTLKIFKGGSYESIVMKSVDVNARSVLFHLGIKPENGQKEKLLSNDSEHKSSTSLQKARKMQTKLSPQSDKMFTRVISFRTHEVHDSWHDASLSFEFALKHGIFMSNGSLSDEKAKTLRVWLVLLSQTLPPQMDRTHRLISHILDHFSTAVQGQTNLNELISDKLTFTESSVSWHTCTYGDNSIGYTCGLWQLFHIMSVGVVEHNKHSSPGIPTQHASDVLRNYIDHFFQCEVCRINYLEMYDRCAFDWCHRLSNQPSHSEHVTREFALWLWETHNDVNVRLLGERLEQNKEPSPNEWESQQARWPSLFSCPDCWRDDRSWEEDAVYQHLHSVFWAGNPTHIRIEQGDEGYPNGNFYSGTTIGVIFAVAMLVVWMVASKQFISRTRRRKKV